MELMSYLGLILAYHSLNLNPLISIRPFKIIVLTEKILSVAGRFMNTVEKT